MSWRVALASLVALTGACTLFVSVSPDEYSQGARPSGDGGADGPNDAPGTDVDADAGGTIASSHCDATFCDDFDEGPLGARWTRKEVFGADLALVPSTASAPNALRLSLPAQAGTTERVGLLAKDVSFPTHVRCSFKLFTATTIASGRDVEVLSYRARLGDTFYGVYLKVGDNEIYLREEITGDSTTYSEVPASLGQSTWLDVELDAQLGKAATLKVDGEPVSIVLRPFAAEVLTIGLGEPGDGDQWAYETLFDDLACSVTP